MKDHILKPTKGAKQVWVRWESVPRYHGILHVEVRHTRTEVEVYRFQLIERKMYLDMLHRPDPEALLNSLLVMYGLG